jgi:PAS domain S-box-containing protein
MEFVQITENLEALIAISDATSNATYFNKAWETLTGRSRRELMNFGWADLIHEEDREKFVKLYLDAFALRSNWKGEFRMKDVQGEYRWLLSSGTALYKNGEFSGYVSSSMDITDQVNARRIAELNEQILRQLVLTAPVGICVLDAPSLIARTVNSSFVEIAGKSFDAIMGKYYWDTFAEAAPYYASALQGVVEKGEPFYASEVALMLIRHGKPEDIYVTFVYTPLKDIHGKVVKVIVWVLENTTQVIARQRIEEQVLERTRDLAIANDSLQKGNEELAQFAHIASHDLQEPLRKISIYSELLQRSAIGTTDEQTIGYLGKISGSTARMNTLIRDILNYSELAKENDQLIEVDLQQVLNEVLSDYELSIEQHVARIVHESLPVLEANFIQMTQLFGNMISNALKFSRKDLKLVLHISASESSEVELARHALPLNKKYYTIRFEDNGIGIAPENIDKIFNIFQRLHRKSEYEGTGIGLAMCKKIAFNHGGAIDAGGSLIGKAVFNLILPAKQYQPQAIA